MWVEADCNLPSGESLVRQLMYVRQPEDRGLVTKLVNEKALAVHELAHKCLTRRKVAVRLDPHRTNRLPAAGGDLLLDATVDVGIRLLHPLVLQGLRGGKNVVGILVQQCELG